MKNFKQYLTENTISIEYIDHDDFNDDSIIDPSDAEKYAYNLAKRVNMGITSDRELLAVALYKNEMVGAIWQSFDDTVYTFDIAVEPKYQGVGIGSKLIDYGISNYDNYSDYPDASIQFDVTSPITKGALERRGFTVDHQISQNRWLMK